MALRDSMRRFFDIRNFSLREALWIAVLVHLILLLTPDQYNPFNLFRLPVQPVPEPMTLAFTPPPEEQRTDLVEPPPEQKAITPEKSPEPPVTRQPTVRGDTNQRVMEAPPQQRPQPQTQEQRVEETGEKIAPRPLEQPQTRKPVDEAAARQRSELLKEALNNPNFFNSSDVPLAFDNRQPSAADQLDNFIQFDTYDWNYEPYRARMIRKLYYYWVPKLYTISFFRLGVPGRSIVRFTIRKDGSLGAVELLAAADDKPYDQAAEHAITSPFPSLRTAFPPLPMGFPKEYLTVTVGFFVNMEVPERERK